MKVVNRVGRGYSFYVIRAKVLLAEKIARKYRVATKEQRDQFQPEDKRGK
jgi:hypothetical protein